MLAVEYVDSVDLLSGVSCGAAIQMAEKGRKAESRNNKEGKRKECAHSSHTHVLIHTQQHNTHACLRLCLLQRLHDAYNIPFEEEEEEEDKQFGGGNLEEGEDDNSIGSRPSASSSREDVADDAATSTSSSPKLIHVASSTGAGNDATGDSSQQGDSDKTPAATAALSRLTMKDEGADAPCRLRVLDAQLRLLTQYVEADFSGAALKRRSQDAASYSSYSSRVASRHRGPPSRGSSHSNVSDAAAPRVSSSLLARKGTQQYDSIQEESVSDE